MKLGFLCQATFVAMLLCQFSICFGEKAHDPNNSTKYLDAVRKFADNVLKYGRDTYGPKHTPLFVDGVNVHTHEPVKWISPKGGDPLTTTETEEWILSNFASQQTLLRTLDGLSAVTGDPKYRNAAEQAVRYAFDNLCAPNGLFYWGEVTAYDALTEEVRSYKHAHALKVHYPYYELMWQVNPEETKRFIEAYWSGHIIDWSNLDFNRSVEHINTLDLSKTPWDREYKGGPTFFKSKVSWASGFFATGTSLAHAATIHHLFSGQQEPHTWSKRLIQRFVDARHPNTGISPKQYNRPQRSFVGGGMEEHFSDPRVGTFPNMPFVHPVTGVRNLYQQEEVQPLLWLSVLLMGEELGELGKEFTQWAREELTAWGRVSYRVKDNVFMPILTDGTSIEGVVLEETCAGAPKGCIAEPLCADVGFLWAYATTYKTTGDAFMWKMTRDIAQGNRFGDIGEIPGRTPALNGDTTNTDAYSLLAFLELYRRTTQQEFLGMAQRIADNIVATKFCKGFFVPSNAHIYARFDCFEPLALLHLIVALDSHQKLAPRVWPSSAHFVAPYRYKEQGIDWQTVYTLTETPVLPLSLQEAAAIGDTNAVRTLIAKGAYVDSVEDAWQKAALHRAVISGHNDTVELLLAKGARTDLQDGRARAALDYAVEKGDKDIAELLIEKGADVNAKNKSGQTPIDIAMGQGRMDIASVLLDNGAEASFLTKMRVNMARQEKRPADLSLLSAAKNGEQQEVKVLLDQGADINAKDSEGNTALCIAAFERHQELAMFLIDQGADVNVKGVQEMTPLFWAAAHGLPALAKRLLASGDIDVNVKNYIKWTPLHIAAFHGRTGIVQLLITQGADVNAKNNGEKTPLDLAKRRGHTEIVELLKKYGAKE